jgi:dTDP-4-amino-4,6-dideoxygalactose transaminase
MISYGRHSINNDDITAVTNVLKSDWLTTGPLVEQFESALQDYVGAPAIVVSSGTAALHAAYSAIGLKKGDEVITPGNTFIATQATAALLGATIRFADIQNDTGNIDPISVSKQINRKTKAIVVVDYAGHPADLAELKIIANKHNLILIEDAAHSIGSKYKGQMVGTIADITTMSFYPTKNITSGEGGAIFSDNQNYLNRARLFARQGLIREKEKFRIINDDPWHQEVHEFGLNYRLPDVLCALGMSQLARIEEFKLRRNQIFQIYMSSLEEITEIKLPSKRKEADPMWHLFPIRVDPRIRRELFAFLRDSGIGVQVNYLPAYMHPVFKINQKIVRDMPNTNKFYSEEISLPLSAHISDAEIEYTIAALYRFFK